jgi:hypothetical protein
VGLGEVETWRPRHLCLPACVAGGDGRGVGTETRRGRGRNGLLSLHALAMRESQEIERGLTRAAQKYSIAISISIGDPTRAESSGLGRAKFTRGARIGPQYRA